MGNRSSPSLRVRGGETRREKSIAGLLRLAERRRREAVRRRRGFLSAYLSYLTAYLLTYTYLSLGLRSFWKQRLRIVFDQVHHHTRPSVCLSVSRFAVGNRSLSPSRANKQGAWQSGRLSRIYFNLRRVYEPRALSLSPCPAAGGDPETI